MERTCQATLEPQSRTQTRGPAALLSFYFLVALFPLLIVLSSLIGFILSSQTGTYLNLLKYLDQVMPRSAFAVLTGMLGQITSGASSGKLSLGVLVSLWTASSGVAALIEALNVAFEVSVSRSWLHRRLVAMALTLGIGLLLMASLIFLFASNTAAELITAWLPVLGALGRLSHVVSLLGNADFALALLDVDLCARSYLNRKHGKEFCRARALRWFVGL